MSGLAEILLNLGFAVSGSDLRSNEACRRLGERGAKIYLGHRAENLAADCSLLVYSSAVVLSNPELEEAKRRGLPVIRRAEVLAELMRLKFGVAVAGSHGKTTTTSLVATILELGGLDPTVIIGGQVQALGSGSKLGKSEYLVAETDESDRSFLLLKPTLAVVTNIDAEHVAAYGSLLELEEAFFQFVTAVPFYGLAVLCADDTRVRGLAERYLGRKLLYGLSPQARLRAENIRFEGPKSLFEVFLDDDKLGNIEIPVPGLHIVRNALAAIAVSHEFGIRFDIVSAALKGFTGVKRRLEVCAQLNGVTIINDYAHHPTEIKAAIAAIRNGWPQARKLHVVFQPHRYTRTRDCFADFIDAFTEADELIVTDIYAASEEPLDSISGEKLANAISRPQAIFVADLEIVPKILAPEVRSGDVILCLGAGSIGSLPDKLIPVFENNQVPRPIAV